MPLQSLGKYKTEFMAALIGLTFISVGILIPFMLPDEFAQAPPGFSETTWFKAMISVLFIGMGFVSFFWLFIIHRFILRKSKKDYMY
ncbi:MAG: hypothetical protein ACTSR2_08495 [Candidatus Hodarchaeales archaeon]